MDFKKTPGGLIMPAAAALVGGVFTGQIIRDGEVIDEFSDHNMVVNQGLNSLLNVYLNGATQLGSWFLGLFEGNYTPVATVTAATIVSASTECITYDESTRPQFQPAAAASQSITNSANRATYTFNQVKTIYGGFLISSSAKSGASGTLFSAARFSSSKQVVIGDQLLLTYQFDAQTA